MVSGPWGSGCVTRLVVAATAAVFWSCVTGGGATGVEMKAVKLFSVRGGTAVNYIFSGAGALTLVSPHGEGARYGCTYPRFQAEVCQNTSVSSQLVWLDRTSFVHGFVLFVTSTRLERSRWVFFVYFWPSYWLSTISAGTGQNRARTNS